MQSYFLLILITFGMLAACSDSNNQPSPLSEKTVTKELEVTKEKAEQLSAPKEQVQPLVSNIEQKPVSSTSNTATAVQLETPKEDKSIEPEPLLPKSDAELLQDQVDLMNQQNTLLRKRIEELNLKIKQQNGQLKENN